MDAPTERTSLCVASTHIQVSSTDTKLPFAYTSHLPLLVSITFPAI